jgi:hypothetical protein
VLGLGRIGVESNLVGAQHALQILPELQGKVNVCNRPIGQQLLEL